MMNTGLDYSVKICIMNASLYSPTKQREKKAMPNSGRLPSRMWKRNMLGVTAKFYLGLKGTGQPCWIKSDMLFRICSQGRIRAVRYRAIFTNKNMECIKLYRCWKPWNQLQSKFEMVALSGYIIPQYRQFSHHKANDNQPP